MKRRALLYIETALLLAIVLFGYLQMFTSGSRWLAGMF
jgi:hypothetical protein